MERVSEQNQNQSFDVYYMDVLNGNREEGRITINNRMVVLVPLSSNTKNDIFVLDCWIERVPSGDDNCVVLMYKDVRLTLLLNDKEETDQMLSLFQAELKATELLKENLQKELLRRLDNEVEGMNDELMDVLMHFYSLSSNDRASIIPRITALLSECDPGYRVGLMAIISSFFSIMKPMISPSNPELNAMFNEIDEVMNRFRKEPLVAEQPGIIRIIDVNNVLRITNALGSGSQAKVYSAILLSNGKEVAVKVESKQMSEKQKINFDREINLLTKLKGVNHVCQLYYVLEDASYYYVVQELITGPPLIEYLIQRASPVDEETAKKMVRVLIETVMACHQKGVVHRDLKPDNIMLATANDPTNLILIDFGYSREIDADFFQSYVGTTSYMAPEIVRLGSYDKRADIWSLGATFYAILTRCFPFSQKGNLKQKILAGEYCKHYESYKRLSALAKDFLDHFLQVDPEKRISLEDALKHPWLSTRTNQQPQPNVTPLPFQNMSQLRSLGPSPSLLELPEVTMYTCHSDVDYYVKTSDKERCSYLKAGSTVPCDRRLIIGGVMWLHCIQSIVYDSRKDRPENKWLKVASKGYSAVLSTKKDVVMKMCAGKENEDVCVVSNGMMEYKRNSANTPLVITCLVKQNNEEYGELSPQSAVMLGCDKPSARNWVLIRDEKDVFFEKC